MNRIMTLFSQYLFCVIILLFGSQLNAQEKDYISLSLSLITEKPAKTHQVDSKDHPTIINHQSKLTSKGTNENIPTYYRSHKKLSEQFSGYAIELIRSETPLAINYSLFERFGNVKVHQLESGEFSYCIILTNFKYYEQVKRFAKEVVLPYVPEANIFKYRKGKRKKK